MGIRKIKHATEEQLTHRLKLAQELYDGAKLHLMQPDVMRERGAVVNSAAQMLSSGDVNLDTMPKLILRIINEEMWRQRAIPQRRWELSRESSTSLGVRYRRAPWTALVRQCRCFRTYAAVTSMHRTRSAGPHKRRAWR